MADPPKPKRRRLETSDSQQTPSTPTSSLLPKRNSRYYLSSNRNIDFEHIESPVPCSPPQNVSLITLPDEMLLKVFDFLPLNDIENILKCSINVKNTRLNNVLKHNGSEALPWTERGGAQRIRYARPR